MRALAGEGGNTMKRLLNWFGWYEWWHYCIVTEWDGRGATKLTKRYLSRDPGGLYVRHVWLRRKP
jgi:hypothetical protein